MGFSYSKTSSAMLATLQAPLRHVMEEAIIASPVDFGIVNPTGGKRTAAQQHELYQEGSSTLDGYNKLSYHQTGWAVDIFAYVNGKAEWEGTNIQKVVITIMQIAASKGLVMEWGGLWKNRDCPHLQVVGYFSPLVPTYHPIIKREWIKPNAV